MRRGEVFWADLVPRSGSEQRGRRSVIVVSHDGFNQTVVPVSTSEAQARRGPTAVPLSRGVGGLRRPGVALCHQVTTLDREKLSERLGMLSHEVLAQVGAGLKAALDLE